MELHRIAVHNNSIVLMYKRSLASALDFFFVCKTISLFFIFLQSALLQFPCARRVVFLSF